MFKSIAALALGGLVVWAGGAAQGREVTYSCPVSIFKSDVRTETKTGVLVVDDAHKKLWLGDMQLKPTRFDKDEIRGTLETGAEFRMDRYTGVIVVSTGAPAVWAMFGACK